MKFNLTEIQDLIKTRRTIFPEQFSTRKVHREQIEKMLESANWAPNHGQTEPWRFKVYLGDAVAPFLHTCAEFYKESSTPETFAQPKYDRFLERGNKTSALILVWMKRQESGKIPEVEEVMATACAVQNLMLIATAYGIGSFWSSPKFMYAQHFADCFHLGAEDQCLGIIYLGYPEGEWPSGKRNIWLNKVEWIGG